MKIGIDARLIHETGVGRYIRNLIEELGKSDTHNSYVVFLRRDAFDSTKLPNTRWQKKMADVPWHSVAEQLFMPAIFAREHLDLLHVPYFNVPLLYFGRFIVTIHDLTILRFNTGKASTLPYLLYKARRVGYYLELLKAMSWSKKIIAVSEATKKEILGSFDVRPEDVVVTYEGVDKAIRDGKPIVQGKYFLYVGNAYPHKNLPVLMDAFSKIRGKSKLVLVGKDDFFYRRLKQSDAVRALKDRIIFHTRVSDAELEGLYRFAQAFVFPSLTEGFGLPALEALASGCPVIVSDIPVFHEILGASATYFDPHNADALTALLAASLKKKFAKPFDVLKRYSWQKMAKKTQTVYEDSARIRSDK